MKLLFLDDVRRPDPHYFGVSVNVVSSVNWAQDVVIMHEALGVPITHMSLDHDLGEFSHLGGDGVAFTDWLAETGHWPTEGIRIHSANPVGAETMLRTIETYGPFPPGSGFSRGVWPKT